MRSAGGRAFEARLDHRPRRRVAGHSADRGRRAEGRRPRRRRLRLLGIDTAWSNDASDTQIVEQAQREQRIILTRDRGLLLRRAAREGACVRGNDPEEQLADVLDRFEPPLCPWTRCPACNGVLIPAEKAAVIDRLKPGTRRMFDRFAGCLGCERVYWAGAHHRALQQIVHRSRRAGASDA